MEPTTRNIPNKEINSQNFLFVNSPCFIFSVLNFSIDKLWNFQRLEDTRLVPVSA